MSRKTADKREALKSDFDTDGLPDEYAPSQIPYVAGGAMEEILNSISHAVGAGMAIAGLVMLILLTYYRPNADPWKYVAFSIYGVSQIILYLSSAVLHGFAPYPRIRAFLARIDHSAIYLLIAGTYTPLALVILRGPQGWTIFAIVWALAIFGMVMKLWILKKPTIVMDMLYLPMGWMILLVGRAFITTAPPGFIVWAIIGGVSYSAGFIFYAWQSLKYAHFVWHLFVLAGSISFYLGYAMFVA
jgi:hemolysin III